jgi:hypothetical protein
MNTGHLVVENVLKLLDLLRAFDSVGGKKIAQPIIFP